MMYAQTAYKSRIYHITAEPLSLEVFCILIWKIKYLIVERIDYLAWPVKYEFISAIDLENKTPDKLHVVFIFQFRSPPTLYLALMINESIENLLRMKTVVP